jgi:hypothetical protein
MKKEQNSKYPVMVDLIIKKEWFDKIFSGEKKEEYRQPSAFNNRLLGFKDTNGKYSPRTDVTHIRFFNGYQKDRKYMIVECKKIRAEKKIEDKITYIRIVIELGDVAESNV